MGCGFEGVDGGVTPPAAGAAQGGLCALTHTSSLSQGGRPNPTRHFTRGRAQVAARNRHRDARGDSTRPEQARYLRQKHLELPPVVVRRRTER